MVDLGSLGFRENPVMEIDLPNMNIAVICGGSGPAADLSLASAGTLLAFLSRVPPAETGAAPPAAPPRPPSFHLHKGAHMCICTLPAR